MGRRLAERCSLGLLAAGALIACNALTGIRDLSVEREVPDAGAFDEPFESDAPLARREAGAAAPDGAKPDASSSPADSGIDAATRQPVGSACSVPSDQSVECASGFCKVQQQTDLPPAREGVFCTVPCTKDGELDDACGAGLPLTGFCSTSGDCIVP